VPLLGLIALDVVKVLMAQNHLSVVANAAVSVFGTVADGARVRFAAVGEFLA
jgi:hypothetical protein